MLSSPTGLRPSSFGLGSLGALLRHDGSGVKGKGFLGELATPRGETATEYSIGVDINGSPMEIPSIVPTLNPQELQSVLGGNISDDVHRKALAHALMRINQGKSPFASANDSRLPPTLSGLLGIGLKP